MEKGISIIIPVYNEEANIPILINDVENIRGQLKKPSELIFIDDGSTDRSLDKLREAKSRGEWIKIIRFKKHFGQTQAITAGFDYAEGDIVITMDADLQNDPSDIPALIAKLEEGYDIVSGWREKRKDLFFSRTLPSLIANRIISFLTGVRLHDYGCTLKAYKKEVVKSIRLYGEMHRFIPAIASGSGISIAEVRVKHHPRKHGISKYGISRTVSVLLDLVTVKFFLSFSNNPMRLFGSVGLIGMLTGFLFFIVTIIMKCYKGTDMTGNPLFYMTVILAIVGVQCILMGILGEMNIRTYHEVLNRRTYAVEEII